MQGVGHLSGEDERLRSRFRGAFLGCLLGDAVGRRFEMMSANDGRIGAALDTMLARPGLWPYTDDTQMMIAIAESLTRMGGVVSDDIMATLAASYDPARGYGHGMKRAVEAFRAGGTPALSSWAEGSKGNGGAVRVVPIACAYHDDLVALARHAEEAAGVTHAHPLGRAGAVAHALALGSILAHRDDERIDSDRLVERVTESPMVAATTLAARSKTAAQLARNLADSGEAARALGNGMLAEEAVPLALFSFLRWGPDFVAVVKNTILAGGDTDTTAAMSGALCGALVGEDGLPAGWLERAELGPRGVAYMLTLADATFALWFKRRSAR
jgi:poly(ADP-ribose) glycohydrolase ARH3